LRPTAAQFEAAASLEIAQVAAQKIANPPHWRDTAKPYLKLPKLVAARRLLVGTK